MKAHIRFNNGESVETPELAAQRAAEKISGWLAACQLAGVDPAAAGLALEKSRKDAAEALGIPLAAVRKLARALPQAD